MDYRLYFLECGHIKRAAELDCQDDKRALEQAAAMASGGDWELWQRGRRVAAGDGGSRGGERRPCRD